MKNLFDGVAMEHIKDDTLSLHDLAGSCKECITLHRQEFLSVFSVDIRRFMSGLHFLIGFDIVAFDQQIIQTPDDLSMSDIIVKRYGQSASDLIDAILQYPKV